MNIVTEVQWLSVSFIYVLLAILTILASKHVKNWLTPYKLDEELTGKDNPALGLATSGYYVAVLIVFLGATVGPSPAEVPPIGDLAITLGIDLAYAVAGILLLNSNRVIVDRLVLHSFSVHKEIIEDRNVGTGAVEAGCLIASVFSIAGAIHGEGDIVTAIVFYVLGLAVLLAFGWFYQLITSYDIHKEIEADNVPAGVAFGMNMVAIGVLLLKATYEDFYSWELNLSLLAFYAIGGFLALLILKKIVDVTLLPGTTIHHEIVNDRNLNAAFIEGSTSIGIAASVFLLF